MAKTLASLVIKGASRANLAKYVSVAGLAKNEEITKQKIAIARNRIAETGLVSNISISGQKTRSIVISVKEYPVVNSVEITGVKSVPTDEIRRALSIELEKPLSRGVIDETKKQIIEEYFERGLGEPSIDIINQISEGNRTDVTIELIENEPNYRSKKARTAEEKRRRDIRAAKESAERPSPAWEMLGASFEIDNAKNFDVKPRLPPDVDTITENQPKSAALPILTRADYEAEAQTVSSAWTGRPTIKERIRVVRATTPLLMAEIDVLVGLVEARRFNDPETEKALELLRSLHRDLGDLIEAVENQREKPLLLRVSRKNSKLLRLIKSGAKIGMVAPALTVGISHLLSILTRVPIDSTMVSTVFGSIVAMPIIEHYTSGPADTTLRVAPDQRP